MFVRNEIKSICESIKNNPLDWTQLNHTFLHKKTGLELWTGSGVLCLEIYKTKEYTQCSNFSSWNIVEKLFLRKTMAKHQDAIIQHYINNNLF